MKKNKKKCLGYLIVIFQFLLDLLQDFDRNYFYISQWFIRFISFDLLIFLIK